jgi:hypothetical protein
MKATSHGRFVVLLILSVVSLSVFVVTSAVYGSHGSAKYLQQDPNIHSKSPGLPFNAVNIWWAGYPPESTGTDWDHDGTIPEAVEAVQAWEALVPELDFLLVPGEGPLAAKLFFRIVDDCPLGTIACWWLINYFEDTDRGAAYWFRAWVDLKPNPSVPWTAHGKRDAILHEIGHFVGLHHQFDDGPGGSCSFIGSIMNLGSAALGAVIANGQGQCVSQHDPAVPHQLSAIDDDNTTIYWTSKGIDGIWKTNVNSIQFTCVPQGGSFNLTLSWRDGVWADSWHGRGVWFWDPLTFETGSLDWQFVPFHLGFTTSSKPVGFPDPLPKTWNLAQMGWLPHRWYFGGVYAWNWAPIDPNARATPVEWSSGIRPDFNCGG